MDKRLLNEQITAGVDLNANSLTAAFEMQAYRRISFQVKLDIGTIGATITTIQVSNNGTDWFNTASTITGEGVVAIEDMAYKYARARVSTVAGLAATGTIYALAKSI